MNHVQNLSSNPLNNPSNHQKLEIEGFVVPSEDGHDQLSKRKGYSSCPKKFIGDSLVEEAHGDDEEDGDGWGQGVEEVELGDVDVVDGGKGLLHALGLVENEVVPKHHQNQQNP